MSGDSGGTDFSSIFDTFFNYGRRQREALEALQKTQQELDRLEQELPDQVRYARGVGASWDMIGKALGISQQAAHKRWARMVAGDDEVQLPEIRLASDPETGGPAYRAMPPDGDEGANGGPASGDWV